MCQDLSEGLIGSQNGFIFLLLRLGIIKDHEYLKSLLNSPRGAIASPDLISLGRICQWKQSRASISKTIMFWENARTDACTHTRTHALTHARTRARTHTRTYTHARTGTHTHTHTHIHNTAQHSTAQHGTARHSTAHNLKTNWGWNCWGIASDL